MKTKDGIFKTYLLSEKTITGKTMNILVGRNDKEQSPSPDSNSYKRNRLHGNNDVSYRNFLEYFEKNRSKTKYPFIVDWQMSDT